ncbi:eukaryotic translation initiation factor 3 subunit F-like [Oscarella lobularis]|uniref:eukaryotic translation initiation factor 3 subunit F-like n=1 Tax=Oscarella lobularis TaxID=121494 RepID=UPI003313879F
MAVASSCHAHKVLVHPVALFSVLDAYQRRPEEGRRIIGTLMGVAEKGTVEVKAAFVVPHQEPDEEVHIDLEFASNMVEQHKKVKSKDVVVGWFATGVTVNEHSSLIHDYYKRTTTSGLSPIHLTIDTTLANARLGIKSYIGAPMGVPGKVQGTIFLSIPHQITNYAPEKVAVSQLQNVSSRFVALGSDLNHVVNSAEKMLHLLQQIIDYVDNVLSGKIAADSSVGRMLFDAVANVPHINTEEFEAMMTSSMEDLLTVVYLASLSRSQLALGEKLTSILA